MFSEGALDGEGTKKESRQNVPAVSTIIRKRRPKETGWTSLWSLLESMTIFAKLKEYKFTLH